jgi:hypothetical protein
LIRLVVGEKRKLRNEVEVLCFFLQAKVPCRAVPTWLAIRLSSLEKPEEGIGDEGR